MYFDRFDRFSRGKAFIKIKLNTCLAAWALWSCGMQSKEHVDILAKLAGTHAGQMDLKLSFKDAINEECVLMSSQGTGQSFFSNFNSISIKLLYRP